MKSLVLLSFLTVFLTLPPRAAAQGIRGARNRHWKLAGLGREPARSRLKHGKAGLVQRRSPLRHHLPGDWRPMYSFAAVPNRDDATVYSPSRS